MAEGGSHLGRRGMAALAAALLALACTVWSCQGTAQQGSTLAQKLFLLSQTDRTLSDAAARVKPGAYSAPAKEQELSYIQRALYDDEHGTTPKRVVAMEEAEARQQKLAEENKRDKAQAVAHAKRLYSTKELAAAHKALAAANKARPKAASAAAPVHSAVPPPSIAKPAAGGGMGENVPHGAAWREKENKIKKEYGREIAAEQQTTMNRVTQLKDSIEKQVIKVLQEGKAKVANLKGKEQAAVTVVKYDRKQADLQKQLRDVQRHAAAQVEALKHQLTAVNSLERKYSSNPTTPLAPVSVSAASAQMRAAAKNVETQQLAKARPEDYTAEDAEKQKKMREKVKADAYAKSTKDEASLQTQLEAALEREVLSMNKHPHVVEADRKTLARKHLANKASVQVTTGATASVSSQETATSATPIARHMGQTAGPATRRDAKGKSQAKGKRRQDLVRSVATQSPASEIMKMIGSAPARPPKASAATRATFAASTAVTTPVADNSARQAQTASAMPAHGPSPFQVQIKWAEKRGMPAKLASDPIKAKKIIARMKAQAVLQKLENSIKSDQSFVKSVEKKAEKADQGQ